VSGRNNGAGVRSGRLVGHRRHRRGEDVRVCGFELFTKDLWQLVWVAEGMKGFDKLMFFCFQMMRR